MPQSLTLFSAPLPQEFAVHQRHRIKKMVISHRLPSRPRFGVLPIRRRWCLIFYRLYGAFTNQKWQPNRCGETLLPFEKDAKKESTIWQVLVGRHPTLSRVVCFVFSNFQAQLHWQGSKAIAIPERPSPRRMPVPFNGSQLTPAPSEQYWESFLVYEAVNVRHLSSEAVFNRWRTILPLHNLRLNTEDGAWTVPPNTRYGYVGDIVSKGDVEGEYEKQ